MNILFVDDLNVFAPRFGAEQRSNLLLNACCTIAQVDVVLFERYDVTPNIDNCQIVFEDNIYNNYTFWDIFKSLLYFNYKYLSGVNRRKQEIISNSLRKKKYDFIVVRYLPKAINYGLLPYIDKLVIDIDDNPITCLQNQIKSTINHNLINLAKRIYWQIKLPFIKRSLCNFTGDIRIPFVSNIEDTHINESKCVYLPNVSFSEPNVDFCDFSKTTKRVIWVGLVSYQPNYLGLEHFFEYIYPIVLSKIPDFEVVVIGKYDAYDISRWQKLKGVFVKGFVENLELEYASARAAIVPCYSGAGTNIKVIEAMRMKRPCITSEIGARGYNSFFENNSDYLVSKDDESFAASIVEMLENEHRNYTISNNGFEKASKYFSKDSFLNIIASSFRKLYDK